MKGEIFVDKIIKKIFFGIGWGCTFFVICGMISAGIVEQGAMFSGTQFIKQAICSMIAGIGFSVPSIVYENDRISRGLQVLIHMGIGLIIYFIVGFYAGWIPVKGGMMSTIFTIVFMIGISFAIWFGFYIYNKSEAKKMNKKLKEKI